MWKSTNEFVFLLWIPHIISMVLREGKYSEKNKQVSALNDLHSQVNNLYTITAGLKVFENNVFVN